MTPPPRAVALAAIADGLAHVNVIRDRLVDVLENDVSLQETRAFLGALQAGGWCEYRPPLGYQLTPEGQAAAKHLPAHARPQDRE
jgi:Mn-dependent DtxR family transcriptional regulator